MNRMRLFSGALALTMLLSLLPVQALAAPETAEDRAPLHREETLHLETEETGEEPEETEETEEPEEPEEPVEPEEPEETEEEPEEETVSVLAVEAEGDFTYSVLSETEKTCAVAGYTGAETELVIPETLGGIG